MRSKRNGPGRASDSDESPQEVPPIPDEDGPHDVPDDKVIEKTLPTPPVRDTGSSGRGKKG